MTLIGQAALTKLYAGLLPRLRLHISLQSVTRYIFLLSAHSCISIISSLKFLAFTLSSLANFKKYRNQSWLKELMAFLTLWPNSSSVSLCLPSANTAVNELPIYLSSIKSTRFFAFNTMLMSDSLSPLLIIKNFQYIDRIKSNLE